MFANVSMYDNFDVLGPKIINFNQLHATKINPLSPLPVVDVGAAPFLVERGRWARAWPMRSTSRKAQRSLCREHRAEIYILKCK